MNSLDIKKANGFTFNHIEDEMLKLGTEMNSCFKEIYEFGTHPENLKFTAFGYSRRVSWLLEIESALRELYDKVNFEVKNIIECLYIKNKSFDYVSDQIEVSVQYTRKIHTLIVNAVMEKLGMIRGEETDASGVNRYIPEEVKREVFERDKGCCILCESDKNIHYHHIHRFSEGGTNHIDNLTLLCASCHAEEHKGEKAYHLLKKIAEG